MEIVMKLSKSILIKAGKIIGITTVIKASSAVTGGFYDIASYFFMKNDYEKRQEKMQKEAEKVGLGGLNKLADYAINIGGNANILKRIKNIGSKYTKLR